MSNPSPTSTNIYNIQDYTDRELYDILGLQENTSNRIVEKRILGLIQQYESISGDDTAAQLTTFFKDMYRHFFTYKPIVEDNTPNIVPPDENKPDVEQQGLVLTKNIPFARGHLNPLLTKTITRVVSIDSQYRDTLPGKNINSLSTNFTFNLSETLRNVVSLKLYSIQLPYTWYTVDTAYGSNFLLLAPKPNALQIPNYTFPIAIPSGNYNTDSLFQALQTSVSALSSTYPDVTFTGTQLTYNATSAKTKADIHLSLTFTEKEYILDFGDVSITPNDPIHRTNSIPSFLGFHRSTYATNRVIGLMGYGVIPAPEIGYTITTANDTVQFVLYDATPQGLDQQFNPTVVLANQVTDISPGAPEYQTSFTTIATYTLSFSNQIVRGASYSRAVLLSDLQQQLTQQSYCTSTSSITVTQIEDPLSPNTNRPYLEWIMEWNRMVIPNRPHTKWCIRFPEETEAPYIWRDIDHSGTSCFHLDTPVIQEFNTLYSEEAPAITNYTIQNQPQVRFRCIKEPFNTPANEWVITVANSPSTSNGYTLSQYLEAINTAIATTSQPNGLGDEFQLQTATPTRIYQDPTTNFIHWQIHLKRVYTTEYFEADTTRTMLGALGPQWSSPPTSSGGQTLTTSRVVCEFPIQPNGYVVTLREPILRVRLRTPYTGSATNYVRYDVYWTDDGDQAVGTKVFATAQLMLAAINERIAAFRFTYYRYTSNHDTPPLLLQDNPLEGTVMNNLILKGSTFSCYINWAVQVVLTTEDFVMECLDTTWSDHLYLPTISTFETPVSTVTSTQLVLADEIVLTSQNNTIRFVPKSTTIGLSAIDNTITLSLTPNVAYERASLIQTLNQQLRENPVTRGSYFYIDRNNRCRIRFNIQNTYTESDYNLVCYDTENFVRCYVGASSSRNVPWNATLGWMLGFREQTVYDLATTSTLIGDGTVVLNLYNYFMIVLDDYNQSNLNDGVVTLNKRDQNYTAPLPIRSSLVCNNPDNSSLMLTNDIIAQRQMTQNQMYALSQQINASRVMNSTISSTAAPYVTDVFGLVPLKLNGMKPGDMYIEFGGTLQAQERKYFGPVHLRRLSIQLINDRGEVVNLNGQNWSFSFLCEQLYSSDLSSLDV